MKKLLLVVLGELLIFVAAFAIMFAVRGGDTLYSATYSEVEFQAISSGDTMDDVTRKLGPPLLIWRRNDTTTWAYALFFKDASHDVRELVFDSRHRVVSKNRRFVRD